jgi:inorganic pyrophosphatase
MAAHDAVIEIPRGSRVKYEVDHGTGRVFLDRVLFTPMGYPADYGFFENTLGEDGDPLDVLVLLDVTLFPGVMVNVRPVGVLKMKDEAGGDDKLVAVLTKDPRWTHIQDLDDIPEYTKREIEHFFEHYKDLEPNKWVKVDQWGGKDEADRLLAESIVRFAEHEGQTKTQGEGEAPKTV